MTAADLRRGAAALGILLALPPLHARAQTGDAATAESLFREGRARLDAKDFAHACPKLEASFRIDPATGTLLALALCYEGEGKTASAWGAYADAAARARREGRGDREKAARARAAALELRLARLSLVVAPGAQGTAGLSVQRDDAPVDPAAFGSPIPVDPGDHTVVASAPGKVRWETTIVAFEAKTVEAVVPRLEDAPAEARAPSATLPVAPAPPAAPPAAGSSPPPLSAPPSAPPPVPSRASEPQPRASSHTAGLVAGVAVGAVGLAGIATGAAFLLRASSLSTQSVNEKTAANADPADAQSASAATADHNAALSDQIVGFAVGGAGVAALAVGVVLLVASSGSTASSTAAVRSTWIAPDFGPNAAGVRVGGAW